MWGQEAVLKLSCDAVAVGPERHTLHPGKRRGAPAVTGPPRGMSALEKWLKTTR